LFVVDFSDCLAPGGNEIQYIFRFIFRQIRANLPFVLRRNHL